MNKQKYDKMKDELKKEFSDMLKSNKFDGVIKILEKYHPSGKPVRTSAQVLVVSEFIESNEKRGKFDPICTFSVSENMDGKYSRVGFGIIPEGTLLAKIDYKGTKENSNFSK